MFCRSEVKRYSQRFDIREIVPSERYSCRQEIHIEGGNHEERILVGRQTKAFGELKEIILGAPVPLSEITLYPEPQ